MRWIGVESERECHWGGGLCNNAKSSKFPQISLFRRIRHENIVNMLDVMATRDKIYIVQELVPGGEVLYHLATLGKFPEDRAREYFRQLMSAVAYCHARCLCHRDIKPENLLITDAGTLKMTDFGLAVSVEDGKLLQNAAGTPAYLAPEIAASRPYDGRIADIWSCGVVLYVFITGQYPFVDADPEKLLSKILRAEITYPADVSPKAKDLLTKILETDPHKRINIEGIMEHEWM
ncbi:putative serine/threonine protein kinase [Blyttiomyces helicus]|uniref:non-specific serine/threonine protein kinase n=1 Tax=Blyttiomyces helicus TaxID=388810 RepID=A0A4P9W9Y9_9FUNG|nr:putative serine/threonine protein kinase [Blyttiomyces helicus]|eukprot:RKO87650.1 putative serine/threonine protein kinase [Blyttiomyces helicus]